MKKQKQGIIRSPKGMHDMLHGDIRYLERISEIAREVAEFYGFLPIQTPHMEDAQLFLRPLGETSDVVEKEMYTLRTKGGDFFVLREIVFSAKGGPASGWKNNLLVHINSIGDKACRPGYKKELTNYYRKKFNYLCKDCKRRLKDNPLRVLDCKEPGCAEIKTQSPQMIEHLCEACKTHFKSVLEFLDEGQIPYFLDNFLVRGFDYYGRTVFEIFLEDGKKEAVGLPAEEKGGEHQSAQVPLVGGGRYDDLAAILGSKPLSAVGFSMGMERLIHEMKRFEIKPKAHPQTKIFLIHIGPAAKKRSFTLMEELRVAGIDAGESISRDNLKTQLNIAAKIGAKLALILGQKEAMDGTIMMRDMDDSLQETVLQSKLVEKIKAKLKKK